MTKIYLKLNDASQESPKLSGTYTTISEGGAEGETRWESDKQIWHGNVRYWAPSPAIIVYVPENETTEKRQALSEKLNQINDPELTQLVQDAQLELMRESEKAALA